ncbi:PTS galactitol transporter subunit IIC [Flavonifractor sp. An92]|uniref:HPr family phosphocarrier protein n=1 Tax=Flavonifractor sp. An92 TaxID=1965666 RepID=UPI000B37E515|nr:MULTISPECIES: HPr family phosphocarrier protein [unclassified Flavonifractor]OUN06388.1 PTS galactitol transporter subunit IIC [Flavonifractor sp. An92]OUQ23707.1 PTS galactitol transporter subunit IIC [Flavonifractor sp. An135]
MKEFRYVIQDPLGIHARPAGMFVKALKPFADTEITISKGDKTVKASQLMKLMGLAVKQGDEVVVAANGPQEDAAIAAAEAFLKENL